MNLSSFGTKTETRAGCYKLTGTLNRSTKNNFSFAFFFVLSLRVGHSTVDRVARRFLSSGVVFFPPCGAVVGGEADTREAAARQPPDLLENKTAANATQILARLITKLSDGAGRVFREAVARPLLTHLHRT